ncbi:hypothetical protein [Vibrio diabolicus]|uniref:hypothetical protein n=1 Tax=Vibrio diabolicus TaxID=50719 RepID=UPI0037543418
MEDYLPTSYFFDSNRWEANFNDDEKGKSSLFHDGLIIGSLLRDIDKRCSSLISNDNGVSEFELLCYQQFKTIEFLSAVKNGQFQEDPTGVLEVIHEATQLNLTISKPHFESFKALDLYDELFNLASRRVYLTNQWNKIEKSNWSFEKENGNLILSPNSKELDFGEKIAIQRFSDHLNQLFDTARKSGGLVDEKIKLIPSYISNKNEVVTIEFDFPDQNVAIQNQLILCQYPYHYLDYFHKPLKKYPDLTLSDIRYFWIIFSKLAHSILEGAIEGNRINVPISFSKEELISILTKCVDISPQKAKQLIEIHTNTRKHLRDFYLKPLFLFDNQYFMSLGVLISGQLTRVIDHIVMENLNSKKLEKGKLFEKQFINTISSQMQKNEILKNGFCKVLALSFKESKHKKNEEIDIIIRIGETYLLIEAKSFIYRTGTVGFHNNFNEIKKSNAQQKIEFFINEYPRFKETYDKDCNFEFSPKNVIFCYLTSVPHATGIKINDMPVVDSSILERYFGQGHFEMQNENGESKLFAFYNNFEEAENNLLRYLENPPQLQRFRDSFNYTKPLNLMKNSDLNIYFKEAYFDMDYQNQVETATYLWSLADTWCTLK